MSPKQLILVVAAMSGVAWAGNSIVGCVGDDPVLSDDASSPSPTGTNTSNPPTDGAAGKVAGQACAVSTECASGFCTDGVCCGSACGAKCEACNLPGKLGTCEAVPDGEDPANECPTTPLGTADAGTVEDDGGTDSGINLPDGGVTADDKPCAGKCNGKRACAYPDATKACGSTFCNTATAQGRTSCDGKGHCTLGIEACQAYSCPEGSSTCKSTCTQPSDCLPTHFCDASNTCKARLGNGSVCQASPQCQSGNCVNGVCCNDACNVPGGVCNATGKVGQCSCPACASGGACTLWYPDADSDTFGDRNNAGLPGCIAGPAPAAGYVKDHTDCDDNDNRVRPSQTAYFATARSNGSFDYDCSGALEKETAEYLNGCGFCALNGRTCSANATCTMSGQKAYHACFAAVNPVTGGLGCKASTATGYHTAVACGQNGSVFTCGACTAAGGSASSSALLKQQRCR